MSDFDVFNGDADGLIALHQLRLVEPREATLITGVKRDIELLTSVTATATAGDRITALDISLDRNRVALSTLLARGATIDYFDHHYAGDIPVHPRLKTYIDTGPDVCTSLIVDRYLGGRSKAWAVAAAFGDNLNNAATELAAPRGFSATHLTSLRELGEALNYNSYGDSVADLHYPPATLYRLMQGYADPLDFIAEQPSFAILRTAMANDLAKALSLKPLERWPRGMVFVLPDAPWSRRISGVFANHLDQMHPQSAHALLTCVGEGYRVSVRLPEGAAPSADGLCRDFAGGGGRVRAAGIDHLDARDLQRFLHSFRLVA